MAISANSLRTKDYYDQAQQGSLDFKHPAMKILKKYTNSATNIIDLGCGEGTRLNGLVDKKALGVDYNATAIKTATNQYPKLKFIQADLSKLPLDDDSFDLAYSAYVLEHLDHPQEMLIEAKRILSPKGILVLIAPNFGAPNRCSPNSEQNKLLKLFNGYLSDLLFIFKSSVSKLNWQVVQPKTNRYTIDADTIVEPYILSLIKYAKHLNMNCIKATSCWSEDRFSLFQAAFRFLSSLGIYPFYYWGPHLCLVLQKGHNE